MADKPRVCIVGGGMITQIQILPTLYHLQRNGIIGQIDICALDSTPLRSIAGNETLKKGFPEQSFNAHPSLETDPSKKFPDMFRQVITKMPKHNIVVVAVPDQMHYEVIDAALNNEQHICCVKPLVLKYKQALEIEKRAYDKGLLVGIEYHKRFDYRSQMARQKYHEGAFGEFRLGQAALVECWYYRYSNFQNWCTCENSDMFTYIGCHYVDLVHYITGLLPTAVSVYGIVDKYPNGKGGFLWTDGRVIWENGACLNIQNGLGYPDDGPGGNFQGIKMYCQGKDKGAIIFHNDQFRGVEHCYLEKGDSPGDSIFAQPNPDYFQLLDFGGELVPAGYGHRSVEFIITKACECIKIGDKLADRQKFIKYLDEKGIMATPANSSYNELVMEAGRQSILNGGREVQIKYRKNAGVEFRKY